jgi:hypothetical protein
MSEKTALSVILNVRQGGFRIINSLQSVEWAAEIIVLHENLTDQDLAGVRKFTDKIFQCQRNGGQAARGEALKQISQGWVLWLTGGESVSPELAGEIKEFLKSSPVCGVVRIPEKRFVGDYEVRYGGWAPAAEARLFKKEEICRLKSVCGPLPAAVSGETGLLKNYILHSVYRDFTDAIDQLDQETDIEAARRIAEKRSLGVCSTIIRMIQCFCNQYFARRGRKDGVVGLFLAVHSAMFQFISFAKCWEMKKNEKVKNDKR